MLRELDQTDVDLILAEFVQEVGPGRVIKDRLRRTAS
jgi:Putative GTP-binding controlling metal-binding